MKSSERQQWQTEGENLNTKSGKVQCWDETMITAQMPIKTAKKMVEDGHAFVMTTQAIGLCEG